MLVVVPLVDFHTMNEPVQSAPLAIHRPVRLVPYFVNRQHTLRLATGHVARAAYGPPVDAKLTQRPMYALVRHVEQSPDLYCRQALIDVEPLQPLHAGRALVQIAWQQLLLA